MNSLLVFILNESHLFLARDSYSFADAFCTHIHLWTQHSEASPLFLTGEANYLRCSGELSRINQPSIQGTLQAFSIDERFAEEPAIGSELANTQEVYMLEAELHAYFYMLFVLLVFRCCFVFLSLFLYIYIYLHI